MLLPMFGRLHRSVVAEEERRFDFGRQAFDFAHPARQQAKHPH